MTEERSEFIEEYLTYNEGLLYWIKKPAKNIVIGDIAGTKDDRGYFKIRLLGKSLYNHRVIYFMFHKKWPPIVDHIDGNKSNNKIENLRGCDQTVNCLNRKILAASNKTGHQGVSYDKSRGKFRATCMNKTLGRFDTIEEAVTIYEEYRQRIYEERVL